MEAVVTVRAAQYKWNSPEEMYKADKRPPQPCLEVGIMLDEDQYRPHTHTTPRRGGSTAYVEAWVDTGCHSTVMSAVVLGEMGLELSDLTRAGVE
jgi:hypothetical protein